MVLATVASGLKRKQKIAVVGSANLDTTLLVGKSLPKAGETVVTGAAPVSCCGGKGLNQAACAARLGTESGVSVAFFGRVGDDAAGSTLVSALEASGVDCGGVEAVAGTTSGLGFVVLEDSGTVLSIVSRGANFEWAPECGAPEWARAAVDGCAVVLLQREIPEFVNEAVALAAKDAGCVVIQDGGGEDRPMSDAHLGRCDYVSPRAGRGELPSFHGRERLGGHTRETKDLHGRRRTTSRGEMIPSPSHT